MKKDNPMVVPSASISPDGDNLSVPCATINLGDQNICYIKQRENEIADSLRELVASIFLRLGHQQYFGDCDAEIKKLASSIAANQIPK